MLQRVLPLLLVAAMAFALLPVISSAASERYDFDGDGSVSIGDVSALLDALAVGTSDARYDLTEDNTVSIEDVSMLLDLLSTGIPDDPEVQTSDVLTNSNTVKNSNTTYIDWTTTGTSGAVYVGQAAGGNSSIQIRSATNKGCSGIITTESGGKIVSVTVTFNSNTAEGRTLDIYGKNDAYEAVDDLYDASTAGTLIGSLAYDGSTATVSLEVEGEYTYLGLRSQNGAMYIDEIVIVWSGSSGSGPDDPGPDDPGTTVSDTLNNANTYGGLGTSYKDWTLTGTSGAIYQGNSAGQYTTIQLNNKNNAAGIVTTKSGGRVASVTVTFNTNTYNGRVLDIYGKNSAYSASSDLFVTANQGSKLGSITYDNTADATQTFTVSGDYTYLGIRSNSGAIYLDEIVIVWGGSSGTPDPEKTDLEKVNAELSALSFAETVSSGAEVEVPLSGATYSDVTFDWEVSGDMGVLIDGTLLFEDVETDTEVTVTALATLGNETAEKQFTVTIKAPGGSTEPEGTYDVLTNSNTIGKTTTTYTAWTLTGTSGAIYKGVSAGGASGDPSIQIRSNTDSAGTHAGIVTSKTGGTAIFISVTFTTSTSTGRTVEVYGKTTAYSSADDLFDSSAQGTKIASFIYDGTTVTYSAVIEGDYTFIGLRSKSGALYLEEVRVGWTPREVGPAPETVVEEQVSYPVADSLSDGNPNLAPGIKSTGSVEVLVIPVAFSNKSYNASSVKTKLEKAFNGTPADTGWHSLSSYYSTVSFGALNIHATVTDVYVTGDAYSETSGEAGVTDYKYLTGALEYFDGSYNYANFDADGDGSIDCVYLVYLAPYSTSDNASDLWWAYTSAYDGDKTFDGKDVFWYMWFSIDFFDEKIYNDGDVEDDLGVTINCETVIHETGHALGLDDYYDWVNNSQPGLGGLVMMDWNQGDHDPFSKAILGWINPTVLKAGEYTTTLSSYTTAGDALFVKRNDTDSYFDECFIITFYTPDGVNALKAQNSEELGYDFGVLSKAGILVYHVNATLKNDYSDTLLYDVYAHNNGDENDRLIKVVERESCVEDGYAADSEYVLFFEGDTVSLIWNDGTDTNLTLEVGAINGVNEAEISLVWG